MQLVVVLRVGLWQCEIRGSEMACVVMMRKLRMMMIMMQLQTQCHK